MYELTLMTSSASQGKALTTISTNSRRYTNLVELVVFASVNLSCFLTLYSCSRSSCTSSNRPRLPSSRQWLPSSSQRLPMSWRPLLVPQMIAMPTVILPTISTPSNFQGWSFSALQHLQGCPHWSLPSSPHQSQFPHSCSPPSPVWGQHFSFEGSVGEPANLTFNFSSNPRPKTIYTWINVDLNLWILKL